MKSFTRVKHAGGLTHLWLSFPKKGSCRREGGQRERERERRLSEIAHSAGPCLLSARSKVCKRDRLMR